MCLYAEEMWLKEHWPRELIIEREEDRKRGHLSSPVVEAVRNCSFVRCRV